MEPKKQRAPGSRTRKVEVPLTEEQREEWKNYARVHGQGYKVTQIARAIMRFWFDPDNPQPLPEGIKEQLCRVPLDVIRAERGYISNDLRWQVWERDNFTCQNCGTRRRLSVDHILPVARGGPTTYENLTTLCKSCNSRKGARLPQP